ncbi:glutamine--fructose-6-phosphate transaminase (isomerizing) [Faecalibaculum rodentium]|uniref:Glutamine--fructose-6-phosphate aminotransferase [isomerizing] n=1 Tax=Faecalibaculum rodentium TaxID=1702221 RepID=A0A1Q9YN20_9FIRM|nr:glutamine--fructose-6-phosphate transaminase (isomerizing) [Faecalibaculum rodentium]OLU47133.1 glutamine--fructose-6-phosphate aminotransferase [Faecalibaculum rodentium]
MCGITAFAGTTPALPFLMQGLEKLEYRGYDSAGVTLVGSQGLTTVKARGRLATLKASMEGGCWPQTAGIGHTRWATHGIPSNLNSHPHTNETETIAIVHNGIIENHQAIRSFLEDTGYRFHSQTDSEVIVHMLDYYYKGDMLEAIRNTVRYLEGSFALCVVCTDFPDTVYTARKDSPMVLGKSADAAFCASDIPALLEYTREIVAMEDRQIAVLQPGEIQLYDFDGRPANPVWMTVEYDVQAAQKGGYDTFMEKEMHEQPYVLSETLRGRISGEDVIFPELGFLDMKDMKAVYFIACGTAWHAGLYAQYLFRTWIPVPCFCIPASEFRYGHYPLGPDTLCIFVSQSGETADTLAALKEAKKAGAPCVSITNVLGSGLARQSDAALYTCAGPEIAVASTKAYTTQLVLLAAMVLKLADLYGADVPDRTRFLQDLAHIPEVGQKMLDMETPEISHAADSLTNLRDAYFIGRQLDYVSVLEGALKLKEISYIHADAYYAGELKHGPIALIEEGTVVIALATQPEVAGKTISNIQETMARGADVTLITGPSETADGFSQVLRIPDVHPYLAVIPVTILLQKLAFEAAVNKGCDVDKPRNLAKSVTVE